MVKLHLAHTSPINPPSSTPILTLPQIWSGLQRKIRYAEEFVPMIASCTVLSDENGVVTREVVFKPGQGPRERAKEVVRGFEHAWVEFEQDDGTVIRNVISRGSGRGEDGEGELYMTYLFEIDLVGIKEGEEEEESERVRLTAMAKKAVDSSIDVIREMVKDGRIKA
ncbi:hypothetical protein B0J11DRAFT_486525 [Dendryphion nanum]|uniref:DUF1857-domain-containing protein n=1 Tax=Dendryphion nanum TaxID=256645 RepID=A0A9P9DSY7_9PLEO|nr:hypothetical protein B0J11DRAFT_486525 [Dendryphion nanum]